MTDDAEAMRARIAALEAENDRLREQVDPTTRTWTVAEISAMDHEEYAANERQILAALREGRVCRDDAGPADERGPGRA
jgi:hypothetical protein